MGYKRSKDRKYIPGTDNLYINLNGEITDRDNKPVTLKKKLNIVKIKIQGEFCWLSITWLICVSWYEVPIWFIKLYKDLIFF